MSRPVMCETEGDVGRSHSRGGGGRGWADGLARFVGVVR